MSTSYKNSRNVWKQTFVVFGKVSVLNPSPKTTSLHSPPPKKINSQIHSLWLVTNIWSKTSRCGIFSRRVYACSILIAVMLKKCCFFYLEKIIFFSNFQDLFFFFRFLLYCLTWKSVLEMPKKTKMADTSFRLSICRCTSYKL